jgi:hypothetical protein
MKKIAFTLSISMLALTAANAQLTLPAPSPKCVTKQTVGLTDITIDYSRPGVKDRKIFGSLVSYGKVWRTGANAATTIDMTDDVTIQGQKLPKGKYSVFTIPGETEWTVIFNKNTGASEESYKQEEDVLRVKAKPRSSDFTESFTINIDSIRNDGGTLVFDWERTAVSIPFKVPTNDKALENIKKNTEGAWNAYARGANYYVENNLDLGTAMELVNKSLALKESYYNTWVKSQILAKQGNYKDAATLAEKSIELGKAEGTESTYRFYTDRITAHAKEYREKAGSSKEKKKK